MGQLPYSLRTGELLLREHYHKPVEGPGRHVPSVLALHYHAIGVLGRRWNIYPGTLLGLPKIGKEMGSVISKRSG